MKEAAAILALMLIVTAFWTINQPVFGGTAGELRIDRFRQSANYKENKFTNLVPTSVGLGLSGTISVIRDFVALSEQRRPANPLPLKAPDLNKSEATSKVTWLGHSTVLIELDGKRILLDPVFSANAAPFPILGVRRYQEKAPLEPEELPYIDMVVLSHDHYDHLDYESIQKLKDRCGIFYVPLGVGSHLEKWGVSAEKIKEHDWWEESEQAGIRLIATPARHFSGRGLWDRNATLWCSWTLIGKQERIFYSGDGGYGPHFQEIGEKYGPFDLTLLECGQYDKRWQDIHMLPEETVRAHHDLQGKLMIPVHWGAFSLAVHRWSEPVERARLAAEKAGSLIATPQLGESVVINSGRYPDQQWWQ